MTKVDLNTVFQEICGPMFGTWRSYIFYVVWHFCNKILNCATSCEFCSWLDSIRVNKIIISLSTRTKAYLIFCIKKLSKRFEKAWFLQIPANTSFFIVFYIFCLSSQKLVENAIGFNAVEPCLNGFWNDWPDSTF